MIFMDITIGALIIVMNMRGLAAEYMVVIAMSVLTPVSVVLLTLLFKSLTNNT